MFLEGLAFNSGDWEFLPHYKINLYAGFILIFDVSLFKQRHGVEIIPVGQKDMELEQIGPMT